MGAVTIVRGALCGADVRWVVRLRSSAVRYVAGMFAEVCCCDQIGCAARRSGSPGRECGQRGRPYTGAGAGGGVVW